MSAVNQRRKTLHRRFLLLLACTSALTLALAATALADGTTSLSGSTITFQAGAGDTNNLYISDSGGNVAVSDSKTANTAGTGCTQNGTNEVDCPDTSITSIVANLGSGSANTGGICGANYPGSNASADSSLPASIRVTLNGGSGTSGQCLFTWNHFATGGNTLNAGGGGDELAGAPGDTLNGGGGNSYLDLNTSLDAPGLTAAQMATPGVINGGGGHSLLYSNEFADDTLNAGTGSHSMYSDADPGVVTHMNGGPGNNSFFGSY